MFVRTYVLRVLLIDGGAVKKLAHSSTRKNKRNHLEPHIQTSATKSRCLKDTISFSTSPICTKRMLRREKAVRHVQDFFQGKCLIQVRHLRHKKDLRDVLQRVLPELFSPAAGFTAHASTRFWRVLAARAYLHVPFQLASTPGFHATPLPEGNPCNVSSSERCNL